ncbi:toxin-antitoxin system HicB family antitoxin [Rhodopseudomonas sp. WA056]|uniref:toxin-antitoxin system HicB family antitoxin n=1 Tax=Rhodopseudomonas sp. WA056 TaxID=2269367 RepID=UPI0013DF5716|nr:toxin-antitoxin system HicB family antitoxin [Rhodopseudomonas sp. WA056]NEW86164.1 toxin-antitoxin system HicB family antitoxin [Rhodopseudomonas sp. WA056]
MHKCKRIIEGKTYNTETATRLAGWDVTEDEYPLTHGQHLYQNRFGAFFLYYYADDGPEGPEEGLTPYTPEQAQEWLQRYRSSDVDLFEALFGELPEAGTGESKFTLRLPDSLRDRLAIRAKKNGQSLNAWIIKCLERCSSDDATSKSRGKP